ncbi:MAG: DNA methyltransferase [Promethearchaeati archaeon]
MVNLTWNNKDESREYLEKLKSKDHKFERIEIHSLTNYKKLDQFSKSNNWKNKLYWGENLRVASYLLPKFKDKIDLIYIDPPFFSGTNYNIQIFEDEEDVENIAYHDKWQNDLDSYLNMIYKRIIVFEKLLSLHGLIFIHLDWHANHYIRAIMDEIFGEKNFVNSIVWYYYNKYSAGKYNLPRAHDDILVYSKSDTHKFNQLRIPREKPIKQLKRVMIDGTLKNAKDKNGHVIYRIVKDKKLDDVWRIPCLQPASKQWTGYPTQKHHKLLERIIKIGTNKDDLVADFFCGSGTTLFAAEKLHRRWIGVDNSQYAIYLTRKRILSYHKKSKVNIVYPFELQTNLSKSKKEILETDFFNKKLTIKRKK